METRHPELVPACSLHCAYARGCSKRAVGAVGLRSFCRYHDPHVDHYPPTRAHGSAPTVMRKLAGKDFDYARSP